MLLVLGRICCACDGGSGWALGRPTAARRIFFVPHTIKEQSTKTERDFDGISLQSVSWEKLVRKKIAPQHSGKCPRRNAGIDPAKSAFLNAAIDELLDQVNEPAHELIVEGVGQSMIFQSTMVIQPQEHWIESLSEAPRHQFESVLDRDFAAFCGVDQAPQPFVLKLVTQNRRIKILFSGEMAENQRFIDPPKSGDGRRRGPLESTRSKKFPRRSQNPVTA